MVDINVALPDPNSLLNGKSVPSISFKDAKVGDSYTGTITALETAQVRNYESGEPEFWEDGNPKLQIVVTLATTYGDGAEDDGERKVYLFGQKLQAAKAALKEAGLTKLELGSSFTITYSGTKPSSNKKYNDVKLYTIAIVKGTSNPAVDTLLGQGAEPVAESAKLSAEQIKKIETLSESGFNDEEIAEAMKLNRYDVVAVLSANKPF
jgi:uncharacterized protein with beta-barrel porin domain